MSARKGELTSEYLFHVIRIAAVVLVVLGFIATMAVVLMKLEVPW